MIKLNKTIFKMVSLSVFTLALLVQCGDGTQDFDSNGVNQPISGGTDFNALCKKITDKTEECTGVETNASTVCSQSTLDAYEGLGSQCADAYTDYVNCYANSSCTTLGTECLDFSTNLASACQP